MDIENFIKETDSLTFLNSLKAALAELKDELATIEETKEYQNEAVNRARRIMRRIDNQYRTIVKIAQGQTSQLKNKSDIDHLLDEFEEEEETGTEDIKTLMEQEEPNE